MNRSKWITAAAVFVVSTSVVAAPHGGGKHRGGTRRAELGAHFAEKLGLTDAQKQQVRELKQSFRDEHRVFFEQAQQTRRDLRAARDAGDSARIAALRATMQSQRAQMKQLRDTHQQRVLAILTAEQRAEYEAMNAERETRRDERRQQRH